MKYKQKIHLGGRYTGKTFFVAATYKKHLDEGKKIDLIGLKNPEPIIKSLATLGTEVIATPFIKGILTGYTIQKK